ncbi:MAG TPA: hypothetical protein VF745_16995 [Steroidobacteraceae bacterium]
MNIARQALAGFSPREIADFVANLRRVIMNTNPGSPEIRALAEEDGK